MSKQTETLSASKQIILDIVLKLRDLGLLPKWQWHAFDPGVPEDAGAVEAFGGTWEIRKREARIEWQGVDDGRIVAKITIRGEFPIDPKGKPIKPKEMQWRWFPETIEVFRSEQEARHTITWPLFLINGQSSIQFLLDPEMRKNELR